MPDTENGHTDLRGPTDAVVDNAQPTLTDPGPRDETAAVPVEVAPAFGSLTPGTVLHAEVTEQSGQTPDSAAVALPTIEP